jgi:hypothetical protein
VFGLSFEEGTKLLRLKHKDRPNTPDAASKLMLEPFLFNSSPRSPLNPPATPLRSACYGVKRWTDHSSATSYPRRTKKPSVKRIHRTPIAAHKTTDKQASRQGLLSELLDNCGMHHAARGNAPSVKEWLF